MSMRLKMVKVRLMRRMLIVMRLRSSKMTVQSLRMKKKISMSCSGSTLERVLNLE